MYDIIIIGAGPAGLTSAIYGARGGKTVLVLEANMAGGQIVNTPKVENYPGIPEIAGFQYAMNLMSQASALGAEIKYEKVLSIEDKNEEKIITTESASYTGRSVIIATGLTKRKLELEREEEFLGKGVSYCATCDGAFYRDKTVAVVGGGNTALEDAIFLSEYCKKVYLIHRRDSFRGESALVKRVQSTSNVEIIYNTIPSRLLGEEKLSGIEIKNSKNEEKRELSIDGLFIAIGQLPLNDIFGKLITLDEDGYVASGESCKTNVSGIFTAGDCRSKKVRQLTTAVSDGAIAALAALEYLF